MHSIKSLTESDWQLLAAISHGQSNKPVAVALRKSEYSVRDKLSLVYKRLQLSSRTHAVTWYRENSPSSRLTAAATGRLPERRNAPGRDCRKSVGLPSVPAFANTESGV